MKFNPKMTTSYRSHGKWGDFIICVLPISWCANILSNSNFILRMIEWQTESNLFTVRIRGKQWYWVYKLELRSMINSISAPKNLGHNYWLVFNNTNLSHTNFYISLLEMSHYSSWIETYLTTYYKTHFNAINTNSNKNKFYKTWENLYLPKQLKQTKFVPKMSKTRSVFVKLPLLKKYTSNLSNKPLNQIKLNSKLNKLHPLFNRSSSLKKYINNLNKNSLNQIKIMPESNKIRSAFVQSSFFKNYYIKSLEQTKFMTQIMDLAYLFSKSHTYKNSSIFIKSSLFVNLVTDLRNKLLFEIKFVAKMNKFNIFFLKWSSNPRPTIFTKFISFLNNKIFNQNKIIIRLKHLFSPIAHSSIFHKSSNFIKFSRFKKTSAFLKSPIFTKAYVSNRFSFIKDSVIEFNKKLANQTKFAIQNVKTILKTANIRQLFFKKNTLLILNKSNVSSLRILKINPLQKLFIPSLVRSDANLYYEIDEVMVLIESYLTYRDDPFINSSLKFAINKGFNGERTSDIEVQLSDFNKFRPKLSLTRKGFNIIKSTSTFVTDVSRQLRTNMFSKRNFFRLNFLDNKMFSNITTSSNFSKLKPTPDNSYLIIKQKRYVPVQLLNVYNDNGKRPDSSFMLWNTRKFIIKDHSRLQLGKPKKLMVHNRRIITKSLFKSFWVDITVLRQTKIESFYCKMISNLKLSKNSEKIFYNIYKYLNFKKLNLFNFNYQFVPTKKIVPTYYSSKIFNRISFLNLSKSNNLLNFTNASNLNKLSSFEKYVYWKQNLRLAYRTKKSKVPTFSTINNRRLLRTGRVLVLPTNINITLITNSFDVVHSWYIPGLGIKMDCIPGRSTHHTLNIDHAGFYYGQCAEICGRFHHHMPIRVCALPFEHFLIWWYHYGLPYFNNIENDRASFIKSGVRQYRW